MRHEDKCRSWDDPEFCDCGAKEDAELTALRQRCAAMRKELAYIATKEGAWRAGGDNRHWCEIAVEAIEADGTALAAKGE